VERDAARPRARLCSTQRQHVRQRGGVHRRRPQLDRKKWMAWPLHMKSHGLGCACTNTGYSQWPQGQPAHMHDGVPAASTHGDGKATKGAVRRGPCKEARRPRTRRRKQGTRARSHAVSRSGLTTKTREHGDTMVHSGTKARARETGYKAKRDKEEKGAAHVAMS
jgi:hypothetical protein